MCSLEKRGKVYIFTFLGEGEHKFNPTTFDAIFDALNQVEQSPDAAALVTTNAGNYFSSGLDMEWIAESPDDRIDMAIEKLEKMFLGFMRLSVPTVAAICGGAVASGVMLLLAHDYRLMRKEGCSELHVSELDLGLQIPESMMALIRSKLNPAALRDVVLGAGKLNAGMALERGIVDGVFEDSAETLEAAVKAAEKLAGRGWEREIYRGFRLASFPGVVEALENHVPYRIPPSFNF